MFSQEALKASVKTFYSGGFISARNCYFHDHCETQDDRTVTVNIPFIEFKSHTKILSFVQ